MGIRNMAFRTKQTGLKLLSLSTMTALLLGFQNPVFAAVDNKSADEPFEPLKYKLEHLMTTKRVVSKMNEHYARRQLNDDLSEEVYDRYLEILDPTKSYLLASDIEEFSAFKTKMDDYLDRAELRPAFKVFNRYQQRVVERLGYALKMLEAGTSQFDFKKNEYLELERENLPWATSKEELDDLWRKRLKHIILNLRLAGKEEAKIQETLTKRYQNQLNRVHQTNAEDAFQTFMNAFTSVYDPHTQYLSPRNAENFNINMSLSLQGIGAVLQAEDEYTKIRELVPAGPADKTGELKPGDKVIGVAQEGEEMVDVIGWRLDEVVNLIRGPKGSKVRLEFLRTESGPTRTVTIVRDEVKLEEQAAQKEILEIEKNGTIHKFGVIDIPTFYMDFKGYRMGRPDYRSTTKDVRKLITELKEEGIEGLIIDLRNNSGGSLSEANALVGLFIPKGPTVQIKGAFGQVEALQDTDPELFYDGPLTVMVNRMSASASEIFAGAIQDYERGLVVGGQTFGKGTVQSLQRLNHGDLKITQAKFYRISGGSTQHRGVVPDIEYPELFDKEKIGESAADNALPYDTIKPANFAEMSDIDPYIQRLSAQHQQRVKDNPDFVYLNKQINYLRELRSVTKVSLNEEERKAEREQDKAKRLALENERRMAKGLEPLDSLEDEEEAEPTPVTKAVDNAETNTNNVAEQEVASERKDLEEKAAKEEESDALLVESGHILLDYINFSGNMMAKSPTVTE